VERAILAEDAVRLVNEFRKLWPRACSAECGDPIKKFLLWFDDGMVHLRY